MHEIAVSKVPKRHAHGQSQRCFVDGVRGAGCVSGRGGWGQLCVIKRTQGAGNPGRPRHVETHLVSGLLEALRTLCYSEHQQVVQDVH